MNAPATLPTKPEFHHKGKLTDAEFAAFKDKVKRARAALVLDHPFFATLLLKREIVLDYSAPTACVDHKGLIRINPSWAKDLTVKQLVHLQAHEIGHVVFMHLTRREGRNPKKWNIAGDAVINDLLVATKVGDVIPGGVYIDGARNKTTVEIYNALPDSQEFDPNGPGMDLDEGGQENGEGEATEAMTRVEIAQAAAVAKIQGKLSGALQEFVSKALEVKTPWFDILERHMVSFTKGDYSWARPNRRFIQSGYYLPSVGNTQTMGPIVVQVDVSGSISQTELDHYAGHLKRIVELTSPECVHVLYTDTRVVKHETFQRGEEFGLTFYSGGGTDMEEGFNYLAEKGISPDVFVCLTDGYFSSSPANAPGYPVIWCVSSKQEPCYGEIVHFDLND